MHATKLLLTGFALALTPAVAFGDHVLLQDGRMLFNVRVVDTASTESRPLRINYKPASFGYSYRQNQVFALRGLSGQFRVADFISTSTEVGKLAGRDLVQEQRWHMWRPRAIPPLRLPTPEPVRTPPPVLKETPLPVNVAPAELPLEQRLQMQLDMFVREQSELAHDIRSSTTQGLLTQGQALDLRLQWLEAQKRVLNRYYPADEQMVQDAKNQWEMQTQRVRSTGRFSFED